MRIWLLAAWLMLGACGDSVPNLPVNPCPGGGGGGGGGRDASIDSTDGATLLAGKVCLLADPRDLTTCQATGAGGLTVAIDHNSATTADDGTFAIAQPVGTNLVWTVSGGNIVPSVMPAGTLAQIPAIDMTTYTTLQSNNGVLLNTDQGSILMRVSSSGTPLVGARVTSTPAPSFGPFYDGTNAQTWLQNGTGAQGTAWLPGITAGTASLDVTPSGGSATPIGSAPVAGQAITYVLADVP
jgi:hypothetical protein